MKYFLGYRIFKKYIYLHAQDIHAPDISLKLERSLKKVCHKLGSILFFFFSINITVIAGIFVMQSRNLSHKGESVCKCCIYPNRSEQFVQVTGLKCGIHVVF